MTTKKIIFAAPWKVEVREEPYVKETLGDKCVLVKKRYTLISPGTELACLSGGESWFKLPGTHGYTAVSEVIETGPNTTAFKIGDMVFHYGNHTMYQVIQPYDIAIKIHDNIRPEYVPFTRMATIAMTAIRVSEIELGDHVAVTGQGLVGIFAAQLAKRSGATVIGIDTSAERLTLSKACGIDYTINPAKENVKETVMKITDNAGVAALIEASGVPSVFTGNLQLVGKLGEAILLGSPRGEHMTNVTDMLNMSHLWGNGCITVKGAHEWRYPVQHDQFVKHSLERNSKIVMRMIASGDLAIKPLHTHTAKPEDAPAMYEGLRNDKEKFIGVVFDWQ
ncbi:MAG: zinc-binding alcohol dehydrogenase [Spirochaetes bacterium]|nr:zinc-binding alcohol dehydrogenase [Spirochaetota bacterium]